MLIIALSVTVLPSIVIALYLACKKRKLKVEAYYLRKTSNL